MNATHTSSLDWSQGKSHAPWEENAGHREQTGKRGWVRLPLTFLCLLGILGGVWFHKARPAQAFATEEGAVAAEASAPPPTSSARTILDLQSFRQTSSVRIRSDGGMVGVATLVNLNPAVNAWYVLEVAWKDAAANLAYHLENAKPSSQRLSLDEKYPAGIVILEGKNRYPCELLAGGATDALEQARNSQLIHAGLCAGRVYLRNPAKGHRTSLEAATEFLRDQVWGGEQVIVLLHHLLQDRNRETGELRASPQTPGSAPPGGTPPEFPRAASIDPKYASQLVVSPNLEITLESPAANGMRPGAWYPARGNPGIYVSLLRPNFVAVEILQSHKDAVSSLDSLEASALCYLVAFDLDQFDLAYALGTEHPAVVWSDHILEQARDREIPGPDGIGSIVPLVSTGLINPVDARTTAAVFTAGFKRTHGAFKSGEFALKNHGSHYGFLENGVVFSRLQPGLSTIFVRADGYVGMKTWEEGDNKLMPGIRYARQNGVPLVEFDDTTQSGVPGRLVNRWGPGNWSGSEDAKLRTMRSGAALQQSGAKRFLIYAVFTSATPSAMVRVFQAYQCRYGMLLDMNALEHTYLAVFRRSGSQVVMEHLISGMGEVDKSGPEGPIPRFLGFPDNRDFFYLMRRNR
jgi:hypothetical protein